MKKSILDEKSYVFCWLIFSLGNLLGLFSEVRFILKLISFKLKRTGPQGGAQGPGAQGPGTLGPRTLGPGAQGPGTQGPGTQGPGTLGPGTLGPGAQLPGTLGPHRAP